MIIEKYRSLYSGNGNMTLGHVIHNKWIWFNTVLDTQRIQYRDGRRYDTARLPSNVLRRRFAVEPPFAGSLSPEQPPLPYDETAPRDNKYAGKGEGGVIIKQACCLPTDNQHRDS